MTGLKKTFGLSLCLDCMLSRPHEGNTELSTYPFSYVCTTMYYIDAKFYVKPSIAEHNVN